jgi:Ankyrin repeats (3 copies)
LHLAVAAHFETEHFDAVRVLVEQGGLEALQARDQEGQVPLHVAAKGGDRSLGVRDLLFERGPAAIRALDHQGRLPLHVALEQDHERRRSLTMVSRLVSGFPGSVRVRDRHGLLPLHVALVQGTIHDEDDNDDDNMDATLLVVRRLVEPWPESVQVPVLSSGFVPLLVAATRSTSVDVLFFLARRSPELFVRSS